MYLKFYKLEKEPFKNSPDPEFLFLSPSHKEALASLIYGVEQRKGFITITGEVGVGKTSVLRYYLEQVVKENVETIYIFNPANSFSGLMHNILQGRGFGTGTGEPVELVNQFHQVLIDRFKKGRNVVLLIDEAQNMPVETLESLRMLSNLETSTDKLLQIVLVGQPELEEKLNLKELRQLRQRIAIKATLAALSKKECVQYIQHRLATASHHGPEVFTKRALKMIISESRGIPRLINILCDNALITGFGYQKNEITPKIAQEVIDDFKVKKRSTILLKRVLAAAASLMIAGIFSFFLFGDVVLSKKTAVDPKVARQEKPVSRITANAGIPQTAPVVAAPVQEKPAARIENVATKEVEIKKGPAPIVRRVRRGDSLKKLVKKVYGYQDEELIKLVMQHNPRIMSSERILIGDKVTFPPITPPEDK